jgi:hypothetical protein
MYFHVGEHGRSGHLYILRIEEKDTDGGFVLSLTLVTGASDLDHYNTTVRALGSTNCDIPLLQDVTSPYP